MIPRESNHTANSSAKNSSNVPRSKTPPPANAQADPPWGGLLSEGLGSTATARDHARDQGSDSEHSKDDAPEM